MQIVVAGSAVHLVALLAATQVVIALGAILPVRQAGQILAAPARAVAELQGERRQPAVVAAGQGQAAAVIQLELQAAIGQALDLQTGRADGLFEADGAVVDVAIVVGRTRQGVMTAAGAEQHHIMAQAGVQRVIAAAAIKQVITAAAVELIVAIASAQAVVATVAVQEVIAGQSLQHAGGAGMARQVVDIGSADTADRHGQQGHIVQLLAIGKLQHGMVLAAGEEAAQQQAIAFNGQADEQVVAVGASVQLHVGRLDALGQLDQFAPAGTARLQGVEAIAMGEQIGVIASAAIEGVIAATAAQGVVAIAAIDLVCTGTPIKAVIAVAAIQVVIAIAGQDAVRVLAAGQIVVHIGAAVLHHCSLQLGRAPATAIAELQRQAHVVAAVVEVVPQGQAVALRQQQLQAVAVLRSDQLQLVGQHVDHQQVMGSGAGPVAEGVLTVTWGEQDDVAAVSAVEQVVPGSTGEQVIATAGIEGVIAGTAMQGVIPLAS